MRVQELPRYLHTTAPGVRIMGKVACSRTNRGQFFVSFHGGTEMQEKDMLIPTATDEYPHDLTWELDDGSSAVWCISEEEITAL